MNLMNQCVSELASRWINDSMNGWSSKAMNQWISESLNQRTIDSVNQWINDLMGQWISESMDLWINGRKDGWMIGWMMDEWWMIGWMGEILVFVASSLRLSWQADRAGLQLEVLRRIQQLGEERNLVTEASWEAGQRRSNPLKWHREEVAEKRGASAFCHRRLHTR